MYEIIIDGDGRGTSNASVDILTCEHLYTLTSYIVIVETLRIMRLAKSKEFLKWKKYQRHRTWNMLINIKL